MIAYRAVATVAALFLAAPALAGGHGREHEWREHEWREHHWRGEYGPPVVYHPYYRPPPVVYAPPPSYPW